MTYVCDPGGTRSVERVVVPVLPGEHDVLDRIDLTLVEPVRDLFGQFVLRDRRG
jgi:hypothetical protein